MLRPPRSLSAPPQSESALDYEIAREQAAALGRLGRALETALDAITEFDRSHGEHADRSSPSPPAQTRIRLVQAASQALWYFVIQREACGLRDPRPVLRAYRVPAEVVNRMGTFNPGAENNGRASATSAQK